MVLLLETGFVAHRVERALAVPIFSNDLTRLKSGDDARRYNAGLCVASRSLGSRAAIDVEDCARPSGKSLFVVTVAWPEMRRSSETVRGVRLAARPADTRENPAFTAGLTSAGAGDALPGVLADSTSVRTRLTIDLSSVATSEFDARIGGIVAKAIVRAAAKYSIVQAVKKEVKEDNETLGDIVGLLGNAAAVATERADTRSWHLLPGAIRVARLSLPAGTHDVSMELESSPGARPRRIELGEVTVRPGSVTILPNRVWP